MKYTISHLTLAIIVATSLLAGCDRQPEIKGQTYQHSIFTFGTIIDISINGVDELTAEKAFEQLESDFNYMHVTWHPALRNAISRNNQLIASTEWFSDAPAVRPLLELSATLSQTSEGLFNPTIGKLIRLWGFNDEEHETGLPPDNEAIKQLVNARPDMKDLEFQGIRMRSSNPDVTLNFGALAKGFGIRKEMQMLADMGIKNAVINAGGDLEVMGKNGNRPWRIGILHPRKKETVMAYIDTQGHESVFTSGDYERYFTYEGKRYHHIIDPRTGYPATGVQSVTVIHPDAAVADAAATALFVAGPKDWHRIARSMGISYVLLIDENGIVHMNPKMQSRIKFQQQPARLILSPALP